MVEVVKSATFAKWLDGLRDANAQAKVLVRIQRLAAGNPGDVEPVGSGISEMRIDHGPGYRVYFMRRGLALVILHCGGDKSTQRKYIALAKIVAAQWKE